MKKMKNLKKAKELYSQKIELEHKKQIIINAKNLARRKAYNKYKNPLKALENQIVAVEEQINEILGA